MAVCPERKQKHRGHCWQKNAKEAKAEAFNSRAKLCSEQMCKHPFLHTVKLGVKELLTCLVKMYKKTSPQAVMK